MWELSQGWYRGRLEPDFRPMAVEQLQGLLDDAGLIDGFWQLR